MKSSSRIGWAGVVRGAAGLTAGNGLAVGPHSLPGVPRGDPGSTRRRTLLVELAYLRPWCARHQVRGLLQQPPQGFGRQRSPT